MDQSLPSVPSSHPRNVGDAERLASVLAGMGLFLAATRRGRGAALVTTALATGLVARGVSGRCALYRAAHIDTRQTDTRRALAGPRGIHVVERVSIRQPVEAVYRFWRNLSNLPRFMTHLRRVTEQDERRSRWVTDGPAGSALEWDAEIINDVPNQVIGWRSVGDADIISAGSVNFDAVSDGRGSIVTVKLQYEPPVGQAGAWTAWLLGNDPARQIRDDLRRLKQHLEAGESPTTEGQPRGGTSVRPFPARSSSGADDGVGHTVTRSATADATVATANATATATAGGDGDSRPSDQASVRQPDTINIANTAVRGA